MINLENIYEDNSADLIIATEHTPGKTYITEDGTRIRFLGNEDGAFKFKIVSTSVLVDSAKISEFEEPNALELFWKLSNKAIENEHTS